LRVVQKPAINDSEEIEAEAKEKKKVEPGIESLLIRVFAGKGTGRGGETALDDEGVHDDAHGDIESPPERRVLHADTVAILTEVRDEPSMDSNEVFVEDGTELLGNLPFHLALLDAEGLVDVLMEIGGETADELLDEGTRIALVGVGDEVGHGLEIVDADVDHWQLPACVLVVGE